MSKHQFPTLAVNIPQQLTLTVTHEQFIQLAIANRDLQLERTSKGELIVNPPTGSETGKHNLSIASQIWLWNQQTKLGEVFDSSTGFHLPSGANRSPDVAWVAKEKWEALNQEEQESFAPLCPDFVVELRSKSDSLEPLRTKMREYLDNQALLGWLIDRRNLQVEVYRQGQDVEFIHKPSTLSGEGILPGLIVDLSKIW